MTTSMMENDAVAAAPARKHGTRLKLLAGGVVLAAIATSGTLYVRHAERFESTDDAYIAGRVHAVSARVNGTVVEVLTDDNRIAHQGDSLVRLDPRDFQVRLDEAKSDLVSADSAVVQARAQIGQAHGVLQQAGAGIAQTKAQLDKAALDLRRADRLARDEAIAQAEFDTANANNEVATATAAGARSSRDTAAATLRAAEATLAVAQAKRDTAKAAVRDAELQLSYVNVAAPTGGRVGKKSVEVGQRVQPGQPLLAVVDPDTWVVANFKENQLTEMRPGQVVDIEVDAVTDHRFKGTVESFSPGTGATFSLLPPDNATGNFTKVVQRLPVKIRFTPESIHGYEDRLAPGLSVVATVHLRQ